MILKYVFLICTIHFGTVYGQPLSKKDSLELLNVWRKTSVYLNSKDTIGLKTLCIDPFDCTLCGYGENYTTSLSYFFKNGIKYLNENKKLWKIISTEGPEILCCSSMGLLKEKEDVYSITYMYTKPNELWKNYEGAQVVFDYVRQEKTFKLLSITTVP